MRHDTPFDNRRCRSFGPVSIDFIFFSFFAAGQSIFLERPFPLAFQSRCKHLVRDHICRLTHSQPLPCTCTW
ncbi:hypothetical protein BCR43DRAFT_263340 [Syncephalastrum racemosum]|uniref:Uncharacterized protein n=1 Tax=Syncephalastrum racemosum TaxID=13706 RepID=A0A1X2HGS3_SYNRA|nr:hypothetical protein BCR43DRAFT_263340 [Syncephalastrum racemosum]